MDMENRRLSEAGTLQAGDEGSADSAKLPLPASHRRNAVRRIFREMVREELTSGPLTPAKRRELVGFASSAGLDSYEARLIVRAVEYELGMAADLIVDPHEEGALSFLTPTTWFLVRLASAAALGLILAWFMASVRNRY